MESRKREVVDMKNLVVYYSMEGNTKQAADQIAHRLNADILELKTVKKMPKSNIKIFFGGMLSVLGVCPKLEPIAINPEQYDRIILGTPVWAGKPAPAIRTFLKQYNVEKKITALFTFSGGGDNEGCVQYLKEKLPNLKSTIALADRRRPMASMNDKKLEGFMEELINGQ
jgi:flavodoxin